ncbi:unnamed protein product [Nesidiocoris tenuis]|uniref:MRG domain-containing protein n=1 Tax=Nesidiocoris tenuis TaxID=355587 RepID=A0A6H5G8X5_9HEMI|nr:unnamed protein product [Nesidiocoris tenuis]
MTQTAHVGESEETEEYTWTTYSDVVLLNALAGVRPIGACYHMAMLEVWRSFTEAIDQIVPLEAVEERLSKFFRFKAAAGLGIEDPPLPDQVDEFVLPVSEFPQIDVIAKANEAAQSRGRETTSTPISGKKSLRGSSAEGRKTPVPKSAKKSTEPKTAEKSGKKDDKKTPVDTAKKRGRLSERSSTPVGKRRN